jgi:hypothetical protein
VGIVNNPVIVELGMLALGQIGVALDAICCMLYNGARRDYMGIIMSLRKIESFGEMSYERGGLRLYRENLHRPGTEQNIP